jgi:hypothetical protein
MPEKGSSGVYVFDRFCILQLYLIGVTPVTSPSKLRFPRLAKPGAKSGNYFFKKTFL